MYPRIPKTIAQIRIFFKWVLDEQDSLYILRPIQQAKATVFSYLNQRGSNYVAKLARYDMALERGQHGCYAMSNNMQAEGGDRYGKAATRCAEKNCSDTDRGRRNADPVWNQLCILL